MNDQVETIYGSLIQHGPHNNRIYVMQLNAEATTHLIPILERMAVDRRYRKITAKIPASRWKEFSAAGYHREATVPRFFNGRADGLFVAKFFSPLRQRPGKRIEGPALPDRQENNLCPANAPISIVACRPSDADVLSRLYRQVFDSYPVPIDQAQYLKQAMRNNVAYFCIQVSQRIVAAASVEMNPVDQYGEMTDFATLTAYRGKGLAGKLLDRLHDKSRRQRLKTAYTIARSDSPGMNRVFEKNGYQFAGRLINNTQIGGCIRSMNVWYRRL